MRHSTRRAILAAAAVAASAGLALAGCSATPEPEPSDSSASFTPITSIKLQLQWLPQAQFAGYYVAQEQGYFQDEGFDDVEIIPSGGDIVPQDALIAGDVDFAIAWVPKVLGSLESTGKELTDIAQVYKKSGTYQVSWADSGITSVADFEGKNIGSWGYGNEWEIFAAMADAGLDSTSVTITGQQFDENALLNHEIDAGQAMSYNEWALILETTNPATGELYQPSDFNVIDYQSTAGAMLQDAIWADTERLSDPAYADAAVRFLKAITKGWIYTHDHPQEAADISYQAGVDGNGYPIGPVHQLWQTNEVNKLIWDGSTFGEIDSTSWDKTVAGALKAVNEKGEHLITTEPADSAYSNEYIDKALAELEAEGVTIPTDYTPIDVTLTAGGQ